MSDLAANPYSAPLDPIAVASYAPTATLVRDGKFLIVRNGTIFPDICPVTGEAIEPAPGLYRKPRQLNWVPRWALFGLLLGLLPYVILALVCQQKGQISYGLSKRAASKASRRKLIAGLLILLGIACVAVPLASTNKDLVMLMIGFPFLLLAGLVFLAIAEPLPIAGYRKEGWFKLKGCSPVFLDTLPEVPFQALN